MEQALRVRVGEPLASYVPELIEYLADLGYSDRSVTDHVRCLRHLSRWLKQEGLDPSAIDERLIRQMVEALHGRGKGRKLTHWSFRVVVRFLRSRGIVPPSPPEAPTPLDELLGNYRHYLQLERTLSPSTVPGYMRTARWFLDVTCGGDPERVRHLTASDVASFVLGAARTLSPTSVSAAVVGSRSLLRWLHFSGKIDTPLAQAVPWLARRRRISPPQGVGLNEARALLASCDRHTLTGLRDFAVLSVLVRLGLRAGEAAAMELGDIDWRRGELTVRGKGQWLDPLPLPVDVGEALAAYLVGRGAEPGLRHVLLTVRPPLRPLTTTNVGMIVRGACLRAGLPAIGAHQLRHGMAVGMLANGAPLHEIGQVLRHRHLKTTALYAKVDYAALATLARRWPGSQR